MTPPRSLSSRTMRTAAYIVVLICGTSLVFGQHALASMNGSKTSAVTVDDRSVADELAGRVRVLCWVMTCPRYHESRAKHVKATWGKRCNKLLFMSTAEDPSLPTVKLAVKEGREMLWEKTKEAFRYVYEHHREDADWFLKADDDTYVVVENLRYLLSGYNSQDLAFVGYQTPEFTNQGYMWGGAGYALSRAALDELVTNGLSPRSLCENKVPSGRCPQLINAVDVQISKCLTRLGAKWLDSWDSHRRGRFSQYALRDQLLAKEHRSKVGRDEESPERKYMLRTLSVIDSTCCSDHAISFHEVLPKEMYLFDYLIYHLRAYGTKRAVEELPKMMSGTNNTLSMPTKSNGLAPVIDDRSVADELSGRVRVLCWVMTGPRSHKDKAKRIKATWGKKCNKLLFMGTANDSSLPAVKLPVKEGSTHHALWMKMKVALTHVHEHHVSEADWFLNADDNTYVVVENLRLMLSGYNSQELIYFRHQVKEKRKQGYMSESEGYVLSRAALEKLVFTELLWPQDEEAAKVINLRGLGLKPMESQDSRKRGRFFTMKDLQNTLWQWSRFYTNGEEGLMQCCSEYAVSFHQEQPIDALLLDYLIYGLRPFGITFATVSEIDV